MKTQQTTTIILITTHLLMSLALVSCQQEKEVNQNKGTISSERKGSLVQENDSLKQEINRLQSSSYLKEKLTTIKDKHYNVPMSELDSLYNLAIASLGETHTIIAQILHGKGVKQFRNLEFNEALISFKKVATIQRQVHPPEHPGIPKTEHILGQCYYEMKRFDLAIPHFLKAIDLRRKYEDPKLRKSYHMLANCYKNIGEFKAAEKYYNLFLITSPKGSIDKAKAHHDIGILYSEMKMPEPALLHLDSSLLIYQQPNSQIDIADVYDLIATVKDEQKQYGTALEYYKNAEEIFKELKDTFNLAKLYNNMGSTYFFMEEHDLALEYSSLSLQLKQNFYGKDFHSGSSSTYGNLGDIFFKTKDDKNGFTYYQKAIKCSLYPELTLNAFEAIHLEDFEILGSKKQLLNIIVAKAKALWETSQRTKSNTTLEVALHTISTACDLIDMMRTEHIEMGSKLFWRSETRAIYELAIKLAWESRNKKLAYKFLEKSKAILLLDELKHKVAQSSIPDSLVIKEALLKEKITELSYQLENTGNKDATLKQLVIQKEKLQQLLFSYEKKYPEFYQAKYNTAVPTIEQISANLPDKSSSLVSYFITKEYIYTFVIDQNGLNSCRMVKPFDFDNTITAFAELLTNKNALNSNRGYNKFIQNSETLYSYLIAPLQLESQRLIIVPDGVVNNIPFEALDANKHLDSTTWLLRKHTISYAYSASTLLESNKTEHQGNKKILAVAPVDFNHHNLTSLNWSKKEVEGIGKLTNANKLLYKEAKLGKFRMAANEYSGLHFSTHASSGKVDGTHPFIAFADTILELPDIYNLQLKADFTVLSACETSKGKEQTGEGVMSLARGFAWAGVPTVVASLWEVNDEATANIMIYFYKQLKKQQDIDTALRQAKLNYLNNSDDSPYYWAPFILVGKTTALPYL